MELPGAGAQGRASLVPSAPQSFNNGYPDLVCCASGGSAVAALKSDDAVAASISALNEAFCTMAAAGSSSRMMRMHERVGGLFGVRL